MSSSTGSPFALVLDASVAASWLLPDESSPQTVEAYARLRRGEFECFAPELWLVECINIIASAVKRSRMTEADVLPTWALLDQIRARVELTSVAPAQLKAALGIALDHKLSVYDATYLWLALSLKLPLLTHDRQLAGAAHAIGGVEALTLKDLA